MKIKTLRDKYIIATFLQQTPLFHLYSIGDLDDFFWDKTKWFSLSEKEKIVSILLLYMDKDLPVLLGLNATLLDIPMTTIGSLSEYLPKQFYAHLSTDFKTAFKDFYDMKSFGKHYKMGLKNTALLKSIDNPMITALSNKDVKAIQELFTISYPDNWFNVEMLATGQYYGIRHNNTLIGIAGVHCYSKTYNVAALGNITIHPNYQRQGLGQQITTYLCQSLLQNGIKQIGLNVHQDNISAINCYRNIGFEIVGEYEEIALTLKSKDE